MQGLGVEWVWADEAYLRTFAPKNFPRIDFFKTLTAGRK